MSLRHLRTKFFRLGMDFKKKKESGTSDKSLPNWVKADKERFNETKNQIPNAANNNNLQARPQRHCPIYFNESYKLIQDLENGKITYEEALKEQSSSVTILKESMI